MRQVAYNMSRCDSNSAPASRLSWFEPACHSRGPLGLFAGGGSDMSRRLANALGPNRCRSTNKIAKSDYMFRDPTLPPASLSRSLVRPPLSVAFSHYRALDVTLCLSVCPVLSCPVLSCPVLSCPVLSVLSCPVLSCPVLSCPVLSCPVLSCPVLSCLSVRPFKIQYQ